jgi:hypothetical protein
MKLRPETKVRKEATESFKSVAEEFMKLLAEVWKTCNKWKGKNWRKKMRSTTKYSSRIYASNSGDTRQTRECNEDEIMAIEVHKLDADAATKMLETKVGRPLLLSEDAATELVADYFCGLPLAIATAVDEFRVSNIHM